MNIIKLETHDIKKGWIKLKIDDEKNYALIYKKEALELRDHLSDIIDQLNEYIES